MLLVTLARGRDKHGLRIRTRSFTEGQAFSALKKMAKEMLGDDVEIEPPGMDLQAMTTNAVGGIPEL